MQIRELKPDLQIASFAIVAVSMFQFLQDLHTEDPLGSFFWWASRSHIRRRVLRLCVGRIRSCLVAQVSRPVAQNIHTFSMGVLSQREEKELQHGHSHFEGRVGKAEIAETYAAGLRLFLKDL